MHYLIYSKNKAYLIITKAEHQTFFKPTIKFFNSTIIFFYTLGGGNVGGQKSKIGGQTEIGNQKSEIRRRLNGKS
jgi:hypothetical protein